MHLPIAQLVYVSRPRGHSAAMLAEILRVARPRNAALGVTGVLVSRSDLFVQMLEGPRRVLSDLFARIRNDSRHDEVTLLAMVDADLRLFGAWEMRAEDMLDWMWTQAEVAAGVPQATPWDDLYAMFHRLASMPAGAGAG